MDFNRAAMLLHVVTESMGHPKLSNITNAAMTALQKINDGEDRPVVAPDSHPELQRRAASNEIERKV